MLVPFTAWPSLIQATGVGCASNCVGRSRTLFVEETATVSTPFRIFYAPAQRTGRGISRLCKNIFQSREQHDMYPMFSYPEHNIKREEPIAERNTTERKVARSLHGSKQRCCALSSYCAARKYTLYVVHIRQTESRRAPYVHMICIHRWAYPQQQRKQKHAPHSLVVVCRGQ